MGRTVEALSTVNSLIRTMLALVVVGGLGVGAWWGYSVVDDRANALAKRDQLLSEANAELGEKQREIEQKDAVIAEKDELLGEKETAIAGLNDEISDLNVEITDLNVEIKQKDEEIEKLDTAMRLLKIDHRKAELRVVSQDHDPESGKLFTTVEFVEVNDDGRPIDQPRQFRLEGDVVYVEAQVVSFEDKYVEQADPLRSTSICVFQRIFGERQKPMDGHSLDKEGARPKAYETGGKISDFEKKIWYDFWTIANDKAKAAELGIRAAYRDAPSMKVQPGKKYQLNLRASGSLSISPGEDDDTPATGPAT